MAAAGIRERIAAANAGMRSGIKSAACGIQHDARRAATAHLFLIEFLMLGVSGRVQPLLLPRVLFSPPPA